MKPFRIDIPGSDIEDSRSNLQDTRWRTVVTRPTPCTW